MRKSIVRLLSEKEAKLRVGKKDIEDLLGTPPFQAERPLRGIGVVTG